MKECGKGGEGVGESGKEWVWEGVGRGGKEWVRVGECGSG